MNRFFVSKNCFHHDKVVLVGKDQTHQIRDVLRLSEGEHIIILDNEGLEYDVVLTKVRRQEVVGQIIANRPASGEPMVQITLFQSLLGRDKFELVLQKCTEVGVSAFVPVVTERSLVRDTTIKPEKFARWQKIITEAAEQSHRGRIPEMSNPLPLDQALNQIVDFDCRFIAWPAKGGFDTVQGFALPAEGTVTLQQALRSICKGVPETVALMIGPEGGFSQQEVELAKKSGAIPITLGQRILRTETAAIVASALILYELADSM
jgi:16S rRNA (uracil1498-N3)-methyltransferase